MCVEGGRGGGGYGSSLVGDTARWQEDDSWSRPHCPSIETMPAGSAGDARGAVAMGCQTQVYKE